MNRRDETEVWLGEQLLDGEKLVLYAGTISAIGQIVALAREIDLESACAEVAYTESKGASNIPALDRLTAQRLQETKLFLFFAEQLRAHAMPEEEECRLFLEAMGEAE